MAFLQAPGGTASRSPPGGAELNDYTYGETKIRN